MNTPASELTIDLLFWRLLTAELDRRGNGERESGAFLLALPDTKHVCRAVYYDDLCPGCLDEGFIRFDSAGYVGLSQICQTTGLRAIADGHTHPGRWTEQSFADQEHPMMARVGHIGLIVPYFAQRTRTNLKGVGAFAYRGEGEWNDCKKKIRLVR